MEEEILKNSDINNFLQKYEQNDWKIIISKLSKIGLLFLDKDKPKKDFYTFDDFDNIIIDLEQNIKDDNSNDENTKNDNLKLEDLNSIKEPDENNNEEKVKEIINDKKNNKENDINEINEEKKIETLDEKIIDKENPEKNNHIINSYKPIYSNFNKICTKNYIPNYKLSGNYSNYSNYRNNIAINNINSISKSPIYSFNRNYNNNYRNYNRNLSPNFARNNFPCLNYNYSTSSPNIINDKITDPCCNKALGYYSSYKSIKHYC